MRAKFLCQIIFLPDTSIARNLYLPGLEKKNFSYIRTHAFFWSYFSICIVQNKSKNIWKSGPSDRGKKISTLINDWKNNIAYSKNPSKARPWLMMLASMICFIYFKIANGSGGYAMQPHENFAIYNFIYVWKQYFLFLNWYKIVTYIII